MCSINITSVIINVLLKETIGICVQTLYEDLATAPPIPQAVFIELIMESATLPVEFSFNDKCTNKGTNPAQH